MSSEDLSYSFATIDQIYDDGITLIFDGEETASEKHYKCNSFCIFAPEQRVRIIKDSGTYVVEYPVGNPNARCHSAGRRNGWPGADQGRQ